MVGWMGLLVGFIILSYYSVVAGWAMNYTLMSLCNSFEGKSAKDLSEAFGLLYSSGSINIFWHSIFMLLTVGIVIGGVQKGIEKWAKVLMPLLFLMLIILLVNSICLGKDFWTGFRWFIDSGNPLKASSVLEALGQAFFSLSLGMGAMLVYGSYMSKESSIVTSSLWVTLLDTLIAILACLVIFPLVVNEGRVGQSVGLVFITLPAQFSQLPGGLLLATAFFSLLTFAALTSAVSLLEVVTAFFVDRKIFTRNWATVLVGLAIYLFGIPSALAGSGSIFGKWGKIFGKNFFDSMDYLAANWMLPLGGLLIAIYVGWFMNAELRKKEFNTGQNLPVWVYTAWLSLLRFVAPVLIIIILFNKINIIETDWINKNFGMEKKVERVAAANALGNIKDSRAVKPLIQAMKSKDEKVRKVSEEALCKIINTATVAHLLTALKDNDRNVRYVAARILGEIKDARTIEPLIAALKDKEKIVRIEAIKALGNLKEPRAGEHLIKALKDEQVQLHAKEALVKIGKPAVQPLITALMDKNRMVKRLAAEALGKIKDARAVDSLIKVLKD
ncbi:sodium-dependent transporter [Candidatus Riflebacteria bacterium]